MWLYVCVLYIIPPPLRLADQARFGRRTSLPVCHTRLLGRALVTCFGAIAEHLPRRVRQSCTLPPERTNEFSLHVRAQGQVKS
jgi:hypothetical protein